MNTRHKLSVVFELFKLATNPNATDCVANLTEINYRAGVIDLCVEHLKRRYGLAPMFAERRIWTGCDRRLDSHAPGTLAYEYLSFLQRNGLDPDFYRPVDVKDDSSFLALRVRQTHDLFHVLLGFDTDVMGELGVQGFLVAQMRWPTAGLIAGAALLGTVMKEPERLEPVLAQIVHGYDLGRVAKPLIGEDWDQRWSQPLAAVRAELGIPAEFVAGLDHARANEAGPAATRNAVYS